ncbi:MAG: alpha/beta fold hydrolase [Gammaproteobacteria bacterium]|nr:alpha/beta fold hydrolase [Gammaproteobacteria bacterium]
MSQFKPPALLRDPHSQSIVARVGIRSARVRRRAAELLAASEDIIADVGHGVRLLVHHTPPRGEGNGKDAAMLHGWEGSAMATYVLSVSDRLWRQGYRIVRINLRDHGDSHHLNEELFHSCRLEEVVGAMRWTQREFPRDDLFLIGASLGGNFALRIAAGARDSGLDIRRVIAICPVLDPEQTMHALDHGSRIYQLYFMHRWRISLERKKAAFPQRFDFTRLEQFRTLEDMTDYFVHNYTEYPDLKTYLRGYALTGERLENLEVPSTMLLAEDDPVIPVASLERIARPDCLRIETTPHGGHCGFISDLKLNSWSDQFVVRELERT